MPSHKLNLNQWWFYIKHNPGNRLHFKQMSKFPIFIDKTAIKIIVCNVDAVLVSVSQNTVSEVQTIQTCQKYRSRESKFHWTQLLIQSLRWRHNGRDSVSNHQLHGCLLNRLFRRRSKKISKLHVTGLCIGHLRGEASNAENIPISDRLEIMNKIIRS